MIRRGAYKFIHSPVDPDQLFDLSRDPRERDNLAEDPSCAGVVADFRAEVGKRWDMAELDARIRDSQRRRRLVDAALNRGEVHAWDFQPFQKASRQYVRNSMDLDDLERWPAFRRSRAAENWTAGIGRTGHGSAAKPQPRQAFERLQWRSRSAR